MLEYRVEFSTLMRPFSAHSLLELLALIRQIPVSIL